MIKAALSPSEILQCSGRDLSGVTAVVFDVLRATSSMITGLAHGVRALIPVNTLEEAMASRTADESLVLAGERGGLPPVGFDIGNSPDEFETLTGKRVVMTTTNGTVAIQSVRHAREVVIGSLLNVDAVANYLFRSRPKELLLICAGTGDEFSLEDAIGAGALVSRLSDEELGLSDSAIVCRSLYEAAENDIEEWLRYGANGRSLLKIGKSQDVRDCAQMSIYPVVGILQGEAVVRLRA